MAKTITLKEVYRWQLDEILNKHFASPQTTYEYHPNIYSQTAVILVETPAIVASYSLLQNVANDLKKHGIHVNDIMLTALDGFNGMCYEIQLNYIKLK